MELNSVAAAKKQNSAIPPAAAAGDAASAADAFSALMRAVGFKFSGEAGLANVEGQFIRIRPVKEQPVEAKPREQIERPKADRPTQETARQKDAPAARKASNDDADATDATEAGASVATTETAPTAADQGQLDAAAAAVQFEILVQLPTGETQPVAVVGLDTLLAVAEENPEFAKALQEAFGAALGDIEFTTEIAEAKTGADDLLSTQGAVVALAGAGADGEASETQELTRLFRNLIGALQPAAQKGQAAAAGETQVKAEASEDGAAADPGLEFRSAAAIQQAKDLARTLTSDARIEIKVVVQGQPVAKTGFEWSPYNTYAGYNPAAMRVENLANGMAGTGLGDAELAEAVAADPRPTSGYSAPAAAGALSLDPASTSSARSSTGLTAARADGVSAGAVDRPAQAQQSPQQQSNGNFAGLLNQGSQTSATAKTAAPERPLPTNAQDVIEQIKVNITRAAKAGIDRVTIQLKPEDLGRIEVKLEMSHDGRVRATIAAENPATLELLKADARGLEGALKDAGLRASADDLEFNLRGNDSEKANGDGSQNADRQRGQNSGQADVANDDGDEPTAFDYARAARARGGVDTYA